MKSGITIKFDSRKIGTGYIHLIFLFPVLIVLSSQRPNYDTWLNQIVASYQTLLDGKDRTFSRFLLDLPAVPGDVLGLLRDLCVDFTRYLVSSIIRDFRLTS
jgi:hypothetical protein